MKKKKLEKHKQPKEKLMQNKFHLEIDKPPKQGRKTSKFAKRNQFHGTTRYQSLSDHIQFWMKFTGHSKRPFNNITHYKQGSREVKNVSQAI